VIFDDEQGQPSTIVAYPEKVRHYTRGLAVRIAFLHWSTADYPSFMLRSDGMLYASRQPVFSADSPPSVNDIDPAGRQWIVQMSIPEWMERQKEQRARQTQPVGSAPNG
jgi:hypothetical protein